MGLQEIAAIVLPASSVAGAKVCINPLRHTIKAIQPGIANLWQGVREMGQIPLHKGSTVNSLFWLRIRFVKHTAWLQQEAQRGQPASCMKAMHQP